MTFDVVIPIYNEQENLEELLRRLSKACDGVPDVTWRAICVDDGSHDASLRILRAKQRADPRLLVLELSRNFGQQAAIAAGMAESDAEALAILDADLQDPPELIPPMVQAWKEGAEVIRAERESRQERGLRGLGFRLFHHLSGRFTDFPIPADAGVFCLLDRRAVEAFHALPESHRFFPGLRSWIGFKQTVVRYDRPERAAGTPKQTPRRLVAYAMDGILSFSYKPLRMMMWGGIAISAAGFVLASVFVSKRLLGLETADTGFTTLVTLILFLGGVQLIALGLLGEYLGRVYDEVKNRPLYVVRGRYPGPRPTDQDPHHDSA